MSDSAHRTTVVVGTTTGNNKSMGTALLLAALFGPFGLLYASVLGGVVMLILTIVLAIFTFGLSIFLTWPVTMIWAAVAVNQHRDKQAELARQMAFGSPAPSAPIGSDPASRQSAETPE